MNGGNVNLSTRTLGGKQFWTDVRHFHQWRIQKQALTGHYRLIDGASRRHAWGTIEHCLDSLEKIRIDQGLEPRRGEFVITLHGLGRSRSAIKPLADYLNEHTDLHVVNFSYASTRASLAEHANALRMVVENLEDATKVHFVGHSLGNMVVRRYLKDVIDPDTNEPAGFTPGRMVMVGPPSSGAELARRLKKLALFKLVLGRSASELAEHPERISEKLAVPPFEFGIIAGDGGRLTNPLLNGENDLVVGTDEAKLPGAADFRTVGGVHTVLVNRADVHEYTAKFLAEGFFTSEEERSRIEDAEPENAAKQ